MKKRLLSLLLVMVMVLGMFPMTALAAEEITPVQILTNGTKPNKSWGYLSTITVDGVQVTESKWMGDTVYVTLDPDTPADAAVQLKFTMDGMRPAAMADSTVTLAEGKGEGTYTAKTSVFNYSWTFKVLFSNVGYAPTVSGDDTAEDTAYVGEKYTLDLSGIFSDPTEKALTYYVKEGSGDYSALQGSVYNITPSETGSKTLTFKANNGNLDSDKTYTLALTVQNQVYCNMTVKLPESVTPVFTVTNGFDENGADRPGEAVTGVTKGETVDGLTDYVVNYKGSAAYLSVRTEDWGGMAFEPVENGSVTLCRVQAGPTDIFGDAVAGTVTAVYDGHTAVSGSAGMLLAAGKEYTLTATPTETGIYNTAGRTQSVEAGAELQTAEVELSFKNQKIIVTPAEAKAQMFGINNYYSYTEYPCRGERDNGNGTVSHYFAGVTIPAGGGGTIYRVTNGDKVVKAGWSDAKTTVTVTYDENDPGVDVRPDYSLMSEVYSKFAEDSVLLNINGQNHLSLHVGGTRTLKAYRAWEIIPVSYNNWIIEPDFHFDVVWESQQGVVSLEYAASPMTGGESWKTLTGSKAGTAVIEVTYDAVQVNSNTNGHYVGLYGASDPNRAGLVVVTVGGEPPAVDFGIQSRAGMGSIIYSSDNARAWDAEFDTLYFTGETGELKLSPTFSGEITEVAVSGDKGATWTALTAEEGVYTAQIVPGNNILRVTTENGSAYQVVRGDKIAVRLVNVTAPGQPFGAGDTVRVILDGLHTPVPKISGNYNPGYGANTAGDNRHRISYDFGGERVVSTMLTQYTFASEGNYVEVTLSADGESFTLTDGYVGFGVIGLSNFANGGDSHRNIPDGGCSTRESTTTFHTRSLLPDVTIEVGGLPTGNTAPYVRENAASDAVIDLGKTYAINLPTVFADREEDAMTYQMAVGDGDFAAAEAYATFTPTTAGTYTLKFKANDGQVDSREHVITLQVAEANASVPGSDEYDISGSQIAGYVTVSFEDYGKRVEGETNVRYPIALGSIIPATRVPYAQGDTIADVTIRLLKARGFTCSYSGSTRSGFYLGSIGNFTVGGIDYLDLGEFDAGQGSGWMITLNSTFIGRGASDFTVKSGDSIRWQYTCQLGADIGDPFWGGTTSVDTAKDQTAQTDTLKFSDVSENDYFYDAVKWAVEKGITKGTGETSFSPNESCTRGQMVTFLWRAAGEPKARTSTHSFTDVDETAYYYEALLWAVEMGITRGTSDTTFSPDGVCSRGQMAAFLYRSAKTPAVSGSHTFSDVSSEAYYNEAVIWAAAESITSGTGATTFSPDADCTRGQMVTFLYRYLAK